MRELAGRLRALDPEASETLKVIAYFDTLVDGRVGRDGMVRGAAALTGTVVGHRAGGSTTCRRFAPDGSTLPSGAPQGWASVEAGDGSVVWLERTGPAHANDEMVLERLTIALSILSSRLDSTAPHRRAVEVLLSEDATPEQRDQAVARLSLGVHPTLHAIAVPASLPVEPHVAQALIATRYGIARAVLAPTTDPPASRAGIGVTATVNGPGDLRASWRSALVALRLTDEQTPVVRASDLGALLALAEAEDRRERVHADVVSLTSLLQGAWTAPALRALADGASHRALAARAGVHHSTMGARLRAVPPVLGYDPRTPSGRTRLDVALLLHRLAYSRVDTT